MNLESLLDSLLKEGKIKKQETDTNYLNGLLIAARRNFLSAEYNLKGEFAETVFKSAYDGLLQVSRVILLLNGYRPADGGQHQTTFSVAGLMLGRQFKDLIEKISRYRVKRNRVIYHPVDFISKKEAVGIIESSREYWVVVKQYLKKRNKQLELFDF